MVAGLEQLRDELRVRFEVDPLDGWVRRKPRPVENDELEPLGQRKLRAPGRAATDDTAVDEHEAFHRRF